MEIQFHLFAIKVNKCSSSFIDLSFLSPPHDTWWRVCLSYAPSWGSLPLLCPLTELLSPLVAMCSFPHLLQAFSLHFSVRPHPFAFKNRRFPKFMQSLFPALFFSITLMSIWICLSCLIHFIVYPLPAPTICTMQRKDIFLFCLLWEPQLLENAWNLISAQ